MNFVLIRFNEFNKIIQFYNIIIINPFISFFTNSNINILLNLFINSYISSRANLMQFEITNLFDIQHFIDIKIVETFLKKEFVLNKRVRVKNVSKKIIF